MTAYSIDARIMGVPSRMENIRRTQEILNIPDEKVFLDEEGNGCIWNAKRAWGMPTTASHVMVLQDDIELCDNFLSIVLRMIPLHPDKIISLHPPNQICYREKIGRYPKESPYVIVRELTAQGIIMPAEMIAPCLAFWKDERRGDDTNILAWAKETGTAIISTLPSTIQHIGKESVFDPGHKVRGTDFYNLDVENAHWDSTKLNMWTNVVRR